MVACLWSETEMIPSPLQVHSRSRFAQVPRGESCQEAAKRVSECKSLACRFNKRECADAFAQSRDRRVVPFEDPRMLDCATSTASTLDGADLIPAKMPTIGAPVATAQLCRP